MNKLAILLTFFIIPFMATAAIESQHSMASDKDSEFVKDLRCSAHKEKHNKQFKLRDFAGDWVFNGTTVGGVAGPSAIGTSTVSIGQVHMGTQGTGTASFISGSIYAGVPGHITAFQRVSTPTTPAAEITIVLTDPVNGVGTLTINSTLLPPFFHTYDIIAIRSKKTGQVIKLISQQNNQNASSTESNVNIVVWERQAQ